MWILSHLPHPTCALARYCPEGDYYYRFKRGNRMTVIAGRHKGVEGLVTGPYFSTPLPRQMNNRTLPMGGRP